jgi:hypothetical protein
VTPEVQKFLSDIKPTADKIRAGLDAAEGFAKTLDASLLGKIVEKLPEVGTVVNGILAALQVIDSGADALDGVIDAYANPAAAPVLPQESVPK